MKKAVTALVIVFYFITFKSNAQEVSMADSLALVDLYNATNGPGWVTKTNWLSGRPVRTWAGVTHSNGRLRTLSLSYNNLAGSIPESIGNLTGMILLNLNGNKLRGNIPASIGNLTSLERLFLETNQLSGNLPATISQLANLQYLYLSENQLSGSIPGSIGQLVNLQYLMLTKNQLSGSIPPNIGSLANIVWLYLDENQLSGSIPSAIGNLTGAQRIFLQKNQLAGSVPASVGSLTSLDISDNKFTFTDFEPSFANGNSIRGNYSPQSVLPVKVSNGQLIISPGGSPANNTIIWASIPDASVAQVGQDTSFTPPDGKFYTALAYNSTIPSLELTTDIASVTSSKCTWTGALTSQWEYGGNWSCNFSPTQNIDVYINSGTVVISSNVTIKSLHLSNGASIIVNEGYKLTIKEQ